MVCLMYKYWIYITRTVRGWYNIAAVAAGLLFRRRGCLANCFNFLTPKLISQIFRNRTKWVMQAVNTCCSSNNIRDQASFHKKIAFSLPRRKKCFTHLHLFSLLLLHHYLNFFLFFPVLPLSIQWLQWTTTTTSGECVLSTQLRNWDWRARCGQLPS